MAVATELLVVAANTGLLVILGLDRVNTDKVAAVAFGGVITLECVGAQIGIRTTTCMTISTE